MVSKKRVVLSLITLLSVLLASQVFSTTSNSKSTKLTENLLPITKTSKRIYGTLVTTDNKPIVVNNRSVLPGTTILPGSTISTPEGVSAEVMLEPMGRVILAPQTEVTVFYGEDLIEVKLIRHCIILTTNQGTRGKVIISPDRVEEIGPEQRAFTDICKGERDDLPPVIGEGAAYRAGANVCGSASPIVSEGTGLSPYWLLASAIPAAGGIIDRTRDRTPPALSPSTP